MNASPYIFQDFDGDEEMAEGYIDEEDELNNQSKTEESFS